MIVNYSAFDFVEEIVKQTIPEWEKDDILIEEDSDPYVYIIAILWNGKPYGIEVLNNLLDEKYYKDKKAYYYVSLFKYIMNGENIISDCEEVKRVATIIDRNKIEEETTHINGLAIRNGVLKRYTGNDSHIVIPEGIRRIGVCAFGGCTGLSNVEIPESVKSIGKSAFYDCSNLTSINIPDSVKSIGEEAFRGCESLTSITLPKGVTSIDEGAFSCCISLISIMIPDSLVSIGKYAFSGCESLTSITIPEGVTEIGEEAFSGCERLISISIPKGTEIADNAFDDRVKITRV